MGAYDYMKTWGRVSFEAVTENIENDNHMAKRYAVAAMRELISRVNWPEDNLKQGAVAMTNEDTSAYNTDYISVVEVTFKTTSGYASNSKRYTYLADFIPEVGKEGVVNVSGQLKIVDVRSVRRCLRSEIDNGAWKWMIECNLERYEYLTKRSADNRAYYEREQRKQRLRETLARTQRELEDLEFNSDPNNSK